MRVQRLTLIVVALTVAAGTALMGLPPGAISADPAAPADPTPPAAPPTAPSPPPPVTPDLPDSTLATAAPDSTADEPTFDDLVADATHSTGFVSAYHAPEHLYVEVTDALLDSSTGLCAQVIGAVGDWRARGTELATDLVRFEALGDSHVRVVKQNMDFRAAADAEIAHAVNASFPDSPILTAAYEEPSAPSGNRVIDLKPLFAASTYQVLSHRSHFKAEGEPAVVAVHNNPANLSVVVAYHFTRSPSAGDGDQKALDIGRLADWRNIEVTVQYDLFALPEDDYRPRPVDERVGVWGLTFKDYTGIEERATAYKRLAMRWDLRKQDPAAPSSPVATPITFYIDRGVPREYRELIRQGVGWWDAAFEAVGLENAIVVKDQPAAADWHPTDIRYSMIYWNVADKLNFSGMAGPQLVDPRSGKVLKANVYLNSEFLSFSRYRYMVYAWWRAPGVGEGEAPWAGGASQAARLKRHWIETGGRRCDYSASFSSQLAFARLLLQSRGHIQPGSAEQDAYAREAFLELVAHEIGHALGFAHNFKASQLQDYGAIQTGEVGTLLTASVMDYNPINLPAAGQEPGAFFIDGLGPYDHFMVEYLYRPFDGLTASEEAEALDQIATRAETERGIIFDSGVLSGADPTSSTDDLGDDSLAFARDRLEMVHEVLPRLPELVVAEGHKYNVIQSALDAAVVSIAMDYFDLISRHVGGRRLSRAHPPAGADAAGSTPPLPIEPLPGERQRQALDLLGEYLFADEAFVVDADFLNRLQADLLYDWNYSYRFGRDYIYESRLAYLYRTTLATLLEPGRLARIKDNEPRLAAAGDTFGLPDLFQSLSEAVLDGLETGNIGQGVSPMVASKRRAMQRIYVNMLSELALTPKAGTPADASVLAAYELQSIRERARLAAAAQAGAADTYARAHLADLDARIQRVLDAKIGLPATAH